MELGDWSNGYREIWLSDDDYIVVSCDSVERVIGLLDENEQLKQEIETLQEQIAHFDIGDFE